VYYFAYADNLNKQQMLQLCPDSRPGFSATLPNYKLAFTGWSRQWHGGLATIKAQRGEKVRGAIYEVSDACLRRLDKREAGYQRLNVTVFDEDSEPHQATAFIRSGQLEESLPSPEYAALIKKGLKDWRLI